jgi:hypothetical protein
LNIGVNSSQGALGGGGALMCDALQQNVSQRGPGSLSSAPFPVRWRMRQADSRLGAGGAFGQVPGFACLHWQCCNA